VTDEQQTAADMPLPGGSFRLFITRHSYQALMSLGIIENPMTNTKVVNISSAKMLIEDLVMLQLKTEGNLDSDENDHLEKLISDLGNAYAAVTEKHGVAE